ncbi:hypothetical protein AGMMS4957_14590 [Bacteroidia bacterium]|nr:hypothetical protein AGMMS4957_14590 [Bacteroidia bacterium]
MIDKNEIVLYQPDSSVNLEVRLENETVWLTQAQIGLLFGVDRTVVTKHLKNIFESGELLFNATSAKIAQVQKEGNRTVSRQIEYYFFVKTALPPVEGLFFDGQIFDAYKFVASLIKRAS